MSEITFLQQSASKKVSETLLGKFNNMGKIFALKTTKETLKNNKKERYHNLEIENSLRCQFSAKLVY